MRTISEEPDVPAIIARVVTALRPVPGIVAIVLGGSRATGTHAPTSDIDCGLYYDAARFDLPALRLAVATIDDARREEAITAPGGWGAWVDGGGWLTVAGHPVDVIYRDLARVRASVAEALAGQVTFHLHWGHPHGLPSTLYAAEVAQCQILWEEDSVISDLKAQFTIYPPLLRARIADGLLAEAAFFAEVAHHGLPRHDRSYTAGCTFRVIACLMQVIFAINDRWLLNEKGAVAAAARLPRTLPDLEPRIDAIYAAIGDGELADAIADLDTLVAAVRALLFQGIRDAKGHE